ncbi:MAG: hypothetical protein JWN52_913 [Actinomycetia bacterium]|nr:hypothetical protein [Actinomycetes bacterium]
MCFQSAKNEAGLDHYQVRHYQGWYRRLLICGRPVFIWTLGR